MGAMAWPSWSVGMPDTSVLCSVSSVGFAIHAWAVGLAALIDLSQLLNLSHLPSRSAALATSPRQLPLSYEVPRRSTQPRRQRSIADDELGSARIGVLPTALFSA